jgi:hypothetical protein
MTQSEVDQRDQMLEQQIRDLITKDAHHDVHDFGAHKRMKAGPATGEPEVVNTSGWVNRIPDGPQPGIALIDRLVNEHQPTPQELERRAKRQAQLKFVADNPDHPAVLAYKAELAAEEKNHGGKDR